MSNVTTEQAHAAAADRSQHACNRCGCYPRLCLILGAVKAHPPIFCVQTEEQRLAEEMERFVSE